MRSNSKKVINAIQKMGGIIKTSTALELGIHSRQLYQLRDAGLLEQLSRGIFCLSKQASLSNSDLVIVATRSPRAIICLVSALAFHGITTQIPHSIAIALEKGAESPRIDYPPISVHRFSNISLLAGIEEHIIDNVKIKVYSPEKTLVDCFKFRNKIGLNIFLEAIKLYKKRKLFKLSEILKYAKICRVENIISPYLETII